MSESTWPQIHGRLESFLQKTLAADLSRVTWYEPCIVDGGPAKKPAYGFVVLTDGHIYLIDNPPRQVRVIVPLSDIIDIRVIHEGALFLKGEDRENAQHIRITFKLSSSTNREAGTRTVLVKAESASILSDEVSICSSNASPSSDTERKQRKMRKFLMSLSWPKKRTPVHRFGNGVDPMRSASAQAFSETSSLASSISDERTNASSRLSFSKLLPFVRLVGTGVVSPDCSLDSAESAVMSNPQSPVKQSPSIFDCVDVSDWRGIKRVTSMNLDHVHNDTSSLSSNCNSIISDLTIRSEPIGRSRTVLGNYGDHQNDSSGILKSITGSEREEFISLDGSLLAEDELNLYILKRQSGFFRHLKSTWTSSLLRQTLDLDKRGNMAFKNDSRERIEQVLQDLHRKLTSENNSIYCSENGFVQIRHLVDKIQKEIARSPMAKKVFWRDPHLFPALVEKLQCVVLSPNDLAQHTIGYTMDKIKACTSLVSVLACVLQETDICPGRPRHLTYRNGQRTKDLLTTLVTMPWIPGSYRELTLLTLTSYENYSSRDWENFMEAPLIRSISELTNTSTAALYQYFQLALEGHELKSYQNSCGISWMVRIISEAKSIDTFISRLMCQLLFLASPRDHCTLTPAQAVLLHQQVSVLCTLVTNSPVISLKVAIMFGEEIRYFILRQVIGKKLLPSYPIKDSLLNSVDALRQAVLQNQMVQTGPGNRNSQSLWLTP